MNNEELILAGMDVDSLLKRLMGNASLLRVFTKKFTEDKTFESLILAFEQGDMKAAEMASHTLKGMCGNLSLMELYGLFSEQVNHLRAGKTAEAQAMMPLITERYRKSVDGMVTFLCHK